MSSKALIWLLFALTLVAPHSAGAVTINGREIFVIGRRTTNCAPQQSKCDYYELGEIFDEFDPPQQAATIVEYCCDVGCRSVSPGSVRTGPGCSFYEDCDGDTYGVGPVNSSSCPSVTRGGDCDDRDGDRSPGLSELTSEYDCDEKDNDCDARGLVDVYDDDEDGDYVYLCERERPMCAVPDPVSGTTRTEPCVDDCYDNDPNRGPSKPEICGDNIDQNCFGLGLRSDPNRGDFEDKDGDGSELCKTDCNDLRGDINPNVEEICDAPGVPLDNNCDGFIDRVDADGDEDFVYLCPGSEEPDDCDDGNADINHSIELDLCGDTDNDCDGTDNEDRIRGERCTGPGAGLDDNCDGFVDRVSDADGDKFDAMNCSTPSEQWDCCDVMHCLGQADDPPCCARMGDVHPGAVEQCNGYSDDCDAFIDEDDDFDKDGLATYSPCGTADGYEDEASDRSFICDSIPQSTEEFFESDAALYSANDDDVPECQRNCLDADNDLVCTAEEACPNIPPVDVGTTISLFSFRRFFPNQECAQNSYAPEVDDGLLLRIPATIEVSSGSCNVQSADIVFESPTSTRICRYECGPDGSRYSFAFCDDGAAEVDSLILASRVTLDTSFGDWRLGPSIAELMFDVVDGITPPDESEECDVSDPACIASCDRDGDGFYSSACPTLVADAGGVADCNDYESGVNPEEQELCNLRDDNCDAEQRIDESCNCATAGLDEFCDESLARSSGLSTRSTLPTDKSTTVDLRGSVTVGPDGSAGYTLPIAPGPTRASLAPELALSYSSRAGDGVLGFGWSLSGIDAISRCTKTLDQHGEIAPVRFNDSDALCWQGEPLVELAERCPNGEKQFRKRRNPVERICATGSDFTIEMPDGTKREYGHITDPSQSHIGTVLHPDTGAVVQNTWPLSRVVDLQGHYIEYTYATASQIDSDAGPGPDPVYALTQIKYTGGPSGPPLRAIMLRYEQRGSWMDGFFRGSPALASHQLSEVAVFGPGGLLWSYVVNYQTVDGVTVLLESIERCTGSDASPVSRGTWLQRGGSYSCSAPVTFSYGERDQRFERLTANLPPTVFDGIRAQVVDLDLDGRPEVVLPSSLGGTEVELVAYSFDPTSGSFVPYPYVLGAQIVRETLPRDKPDYLGNDHFVFGDFNGDGFPDLASHRKRDDDTFIRYGPDFATIETIGDIKIDSMTPVDTDGDGDDELFVVAMLEEQEAFRSGDEDFEYWYRREYQMLERDGTWSARVVGEPERYAPRIEGTNIGANPDPRTGQSSVKAVRPLDFDHDGVLEIITIEEHAYAGRQINREDCGQNTFEGEPCGELTSVMIDREPATGAYRIGECGKNRLGRIEPGTSCPGTASTFEPPFNGQFVDLWGDYNGDANYDVAFVHTSRINTGANTGRDVIHNGDGWTENVLFEDDLRFSGAVAYPSEEGRLAILARNGLRYARYDIRDRAYQTAVLTYGPDATPIPATLTLSVGDLDGNGAADLIGSDGSVYLRTFGEGLLLKEVRHGVNALTNGEANISINYTWPDASDVLSTEALANEVAPSLTRWQLPQWRVVSSMSAWSPEGQITSEYRYEGPLASRTRRWLGFRRVMRRTVESGDISVDVYDHSGQTLGAGVIHPYRARPIVSERISGAEEDDPRIQESEMRYIAKFGPDGTSETLIVCADNSITRTYERAGRYEASELAESLSQLNVGRFRGGVFRRLTENVTNWECDGFGNTTSADTISRVSDSEPFRGLIDAPGMAEIAQSGTRRTSTLQLSDRTDDVWLLGRVDSTTARTWSGYCQAKQFLGAALDLGVDVGMLCPASDLDGEIVETATSRYCDGADAACPTNSPNLAWQTTFDADGRASTVTREFDLDGNVVAQSQLGVADFDENVVERRIEYAYDEVERLFVEQTINRSQDSPPLIASQLWDTDLGVATLTRDVQGVVTVNTFDGFGQVTSSTVRGDSSIAVAYTRASDSTQEITMQDETGASSTMSFDVLGRLTKRRESVLAGQWSEQHYQYDPLGRQVGESPPTPAGETPTYFGCEYDTHDRARRCLTRDNGVLSFDFDGLVQTLTLPDGAQRSKGLDQDGRSLVITNEEGAVSRFIYDAYGRLARYIDPGAQDASVGVSSVFKSDYDARGNLMMIEDPINGLIEYAYSDFNDLVYSRTNVGEETYRFYDSLSRVTAVRSDTHSIDYTYDFGVGASMGTLVSSTRRSVLNESVSATRSYERDLFGRVVRVDESVTDGAVVSTASSIVESFMGLNDSRVNRFSYATSSGVMTASYEYELDFTKRLSVAAGGVTKTLWQAKERDAWGNVETGQLGEWLDVSRSFYADTGRLRDSTIRGPSAAGGASVAWTEDAFFNTRGFLERKDWTLSGVVGLSSVSESHAYRYDGVGRLTKEVFTDSTELELTYDFIGNMRTRGSQVFTPDSSNPYRLAGATYDDAGRVTDIVDPIVGALSLTGYTTEDLPTVVTSSSGSSVEFEYGPTGARVLRREGGRTNHYFFDGTCEDKRSGGALQESACTFFVEGEPVSTVDLTLAGQAEFHVVVADRLGSGVLVAKDTDDGVEVESYLEYSPWGEVRQSWGDRSPADPDSPVGFTGHRDEFGIGMIDMRGRFYMPGFARFATPDPVVFNVFDAQAYQGYAYVRNNPNAYTDPSGFSPEGVNCTPRTCGFAVDEGAFITEGPPPEDGKGDGASAGEARPVEQTADSGPEASPSGGGNGEGTSGAAGHGKTESGGGAARGSSTNGPEGVAGRGGPRGGGSGGGGGMDAMAAFASLPSLTISGASSSFGANLGAFTKGFADGFVSGLAVKVGLGLVAATFGAPVATGIGIAALAYGLYNTDFGALRTSITNIGSGNGTPADFEAAGELASMVVGVGRGRGGGGRKGAPANPTASGSGRGRAIPDQTLVCRGGMCTADNFSGGSGVTTASNGTLAGVSTQSRVGASVETLAQPFRNGQVGVTTVGDIRAAGGRVVMDGTVRNPNHATVSGITAQQAEALFTPTIPNPVPKPVRGTIPQMTPNN